MRNQMTRALGCDLQWYLTWGATVFGLLCAFINTVRF
jgi:hypothetical protein